MARFEEAVGIQPVDVRTGAPQATFSLSQRLQAFKQQQISVAQSEAVRRGQESASQVVLQREEGTTQAPEFKKRRFIGGIEIDAHNKALRAAYVSSLNNDIREQVGRIQAENPDNLQAFNEAVGSMAKGMLPNVDPSVRDVVVGALNERVISGRLAVQSAQIKRQNEEAKSSIELDAKRTLDNALLSARSGDIEGSAKELVDLSANYDAQVESGFITPAQAQEFKREAELRATQESLIGNVRRLTDVGNFTEALVQVEKARSKQPTNMSIQEHSDLVNGMLSDITESINIRNKIESAEENSVKKAQLNRYREGYIGILLGTTTANDVIRWSRNGELTDTQADKLFNTINTRGQGLNDWPLISRIQEEIRAGQNPDMIRNDIIVNSGSRLTDETASGLLEQLDQSLDRESVLNTGEVKRARGFIIPSIRVTGPLGALDTEAERRLARSIRDFDTRVLAGEDPWRVADELVGKDAFDRAPNPQFGTKANLEQAQELLNQALLSKQMNDDDYNFEFNNLERLRQLKANIDAFEASRKESERANRQ